MGMIFFSIIYSVAYEKEDDDNDVSHTVPVLLNARQVTPLWWASFRMDTVWHDFVSHTQMYGSLPTWPVATNCLSGCNAKLLPEKKTS